MSIEVMTLKKYRQLINSKVLDKFEDLPVVSSSDDEGNAYNRILYGPALMTDIEVYNDNGVTFKKAVCIN